MRILTAIDLIGIPVSPLDEWSHQIACPWCHEDAWAVHDYLQCHNPMCRTQVASSEDLLAHHYGDHLLAAQELANKYKHEPDFNRAKSRAAERLILDTWVKFCLTPPTNEALQLAGKLQSQGFGISASRFSSIILDTEQMRHLLDVAISVGAEVPETWHKNPPEASRAFCVQTSPHTIDRIMIIGRSGRTDELVFRSHTAGICSLLGLYPGQPRLLAADVDTAMKMQHTLHGVGRSEEVACVYLDLYRGGSCPRWELQEHLLTAVPRHCHTHVNPEYFGPHDVVRLQLLMDQIPGLERAVRGLPVDYVVNLAPRENPPTWSSLRFAMIASMIPEHVKQMPPAASSIFEQTGTKPEDAAALVAHFNRQGRHQLAEDVERLSRTRKIMEDRFMTVKETTNDYRIIRGPDATPITNFSLRINSSVTFRNSKSDRYCQGVMRCGQAVLDVMFSQTLLNDRVQSLEGELQRQLSASNLVAVAGKMPTVIEVNKFRQLIVPYLRKQAAEAKPLRGVDLLGWSENRKSFMFPGFVATMDGVELASPILCPSVPVLARYKAMPLSSWSESCPAVSNEAAHDIIAMLLASTVRYFKRCATYPIAIAQSSDAMTILDRVGAAVGQVEMHSINHNTRDANRVDGVHGYPLIAAGPRNMVTTLSQTPFIHMTDSGYHVQNGPAPDQAVSAGRAAQYCLMKVVTWCIGTGADEFRESPSLLHYRSLLREGRWLINNVCGMEDWELSQQSPTAIEQLLAQIPYEEAGRRITLIDGQDLRIDLRGLEREHDAILNEARDMGTLAAIDGDQMVSSAVKLLPAIGTYYGQDPDVTVIST